MNDNNRVAALLEDMNGKFDAIMEYVQRIPVMEEKIEVLQKDMSHVKSDIAIIKEVVGQHSDDIAKLKSA